MVKRAIASFASLMLFAGLAAAKDQSRLPQDHMEIAQGAGDPAAGPPAETPPAAEGETDTPPGAEEPPSDEEDLSLGEIPILEVMELTPDLAKRAIDAYAVVKEKYKDADFESYETLQDFVDQTTDGAAFDSDVKGFGFTTVNDWNVAITSISIAYMALNDDPTADIKAQIEEIRADTELAQDMKDRMIKSLEATIPSPNNLQVVRDLNTDPAYAEKLKLLETESEGE